MDGDVFEVLLSIKEMKSEKTYRENRLTLIVATICALLNSDGGELNIKFEDDAILRNETDRILRMIEQRLVNIIGSSLFSTKVRIRKRNLTKQFVFTVDSSQSLCTVNYNFYLTTQSQVIPISPSEPPDRVKAILNKEVHMQEQFENYEDFVLNTQVPFEESDSIQFKHLKSEKSKSVSLANRMTNTCNKLERYISAFANKYGGRIFYGIGNDGVVIGEASKETRQEEIIRKVTKTINQLFWPGGKLERGRHWEIQFASVKDENQDEIPSLFVIIISVVPLRGGLFIQEPESYHIVHGRAERMSFTEWRRRLFVDEQSSATMDMVPSVVGRLNSDGGELNIESNDGKSSADESSNSRSKPENSANQDRGASSSNCNFENINAFEKEIVHYFEIKMGKYERIVENPPVGQKGMQENDVVVGFSSTAAVATAVVTAVVALPVAVTATMGPAGLVAVLGTAVVGKYVTKSLRRKQCKAIVAATKRTATESILAYIVEQAGNELSRIFEYQLSMLKDASAAKIMAKSAVDLMLNLKDGDSFDSNTLLQKVLDQKGSKGVVKKQKLETKCGIPSNKKWHTPSVFWKPGLRKVVSSFDDGRREKIYKFDYLEKNSSKPQKYGFRGEFLLVHDTGANGENENEEKSCSSSDHDVVSRHFIGSDVDKTYITKYQGNTRADYQPYHCLVLRTEDLKWFSKGIKTQPSFARFAAEMYNYPAARHVKPVYRPVNQSPVDEFLDLSNANLSDSDFTAANFMGYNLQACNLEKSVSLFGNFKEAVLNKATFTQTRLLHCNLDGVKARQCTWTGTKLHDYEVKDADFGELDMGSWIGTDISTARFTAFKQSSNDQDEVSDITFVNVMDKVSTPVQEVLKQSSNDQDEVSDITSVNVMDKVSTSVQEDWFETNMLDKDFWLKDTVEDFLIKLEWVESFYITGQKGKGRMVITAEPDTAPLASMKQLKCEFGDDIATYVDIIVGCEPEQCSAHMNSASENNNEAIEETTSKPTSGDAIYINGNPNSYGSICTFADQSGDDKKRYAITCFHVLYNGAKLVDEDGENLEFGERFDKWKAECEKHDSKTYSTSYGFKSKADKERGAGSSLGRFYRGTYNASHDLGMVELDESVAYNCAIPIIDETRLTEKSMLGQSLAENYFPKVFKIGFQTGLSEGTLQGISYGKKQKGTCKPIIKKGCLVKVEEGDEAFSTKGDSGSLVVWEDIHGKKRPFGYCVQEIFQSPKTPNHKRKYICFCLKDSLKECDPNLQINIDNPDPNSDRLS